VYDMASYKCLSFVRHALTILPQGRPMAGGRRSGPSNAGRLSGRHPKGLFVLKADSLSLRLK